MKKILSTIAAIAAVSCTAFVYAAGSSGSTTDGSTRVVVPAIKANSPTELRDATQTNRDSSTYSAACGDAHKSTRSTDPTSAEACSRGAKSSVDSTGTDGTFNWTCRLTSNSTSATCLAYNGTNGGGGGGGTPVNGGCGSANGVTATSYPSSGLCGTGTATTVDNAGTDGSYNWTCDGSGGGTSASCAAPRTANGTCGTANGVATSAYPGSGLCGSGSPTAVDSSGSDGSFNWSCSGSGGGSNAACSAPKSTNGTCGSANNTSRTSYPSGAQACSAGNQADVDNTGSDGSYNWTCTGSAGGSGASCSANRPVDGICGAANGSDLGSFPSGSAACVTGSQATVDNTGSDGSYNWTCNGSSGGANATCAANKAPVNSTFCGTAAGVATSAYPTANHCGQGTKADVDTVGTDGSFNWTCKPALQAAGACSAPRITNGTCGAANATTTSTYPSGSAACSAGTQAMVDDQGNDGSFNWSCLGRNGGSSPACSATKPPAPVNGTCGSASGAGQWVATYPAANQCATGTHTPVDSNGTDGRFDWNCTGANGGSNATCSANKTYNGSCGSANGMSYAATPSSNLCNTGSAVWFDSSGSDGSYNWNCAGSVNGTDQACSATATRVNGACGSANGVQTLSYPASGACASGTQAAVDSTGSDGTYNWTCTGSNGGSNSSCSAPRQVINGACGTSHNTTVGTYPSGGSACSAGSQIASDTSGADGAFDWSCNGVNGSNATCTAFKTPPPAACGSSNNTDTFSYPNGVAACSVGSQTMVDNQGTDEHYNWTCNSSANGTSATCSSRRAVPRDGSVYWFMDAGSYVIGSGVPPDGSTYDGYFTGIPASTPPFPKVGNVRIGTVAPPPDGSINGKHHLFEFYTDTNYPFVTTTIQVVGNPQQVIRRCGPVVISSGRKCFLQVWTPSGTLIESTSAWNGSDVSGGWQFYIPNGVWSPFGFQPGSTYRINMGPTD